MPLEIFQLPVEQEVEGKASATFQVPITMASHMIADSDTVHQMNLTFRGPGGSTFGEAIPVKVRCVLPGQAAREVDSQLINTLAMQGEVEE